MGEFRAFPIALKLEGRACLVIGAGHEAALRARALLEAGARVSVLTTSPSDPQLAELAREAGEGRLELLSRDYESSDLEGVWLAVLTDRNAELASRLYAEAERRNVFFCAVDQPEFGSFSHVARVQAGALELAIGTTGRAPALARRLREILQALFDESKLGDYVERLGLLRDRTPSADRARVLGAAVKGLRFEGKLVIPPEDP